MPSTEQFDELPIFLTAPQAAKVLNFSLLHFYKLLEHKVGPRAIKIGKRWRIRRDYLIEWASKDQPDASLKNHNTNGKPLGTKRKKRP